MAATWWEASFHDLQTATSRGWKAVIEAWLTTAEASQDDKNAPDLADQAVIKLLAGPQLASRTELREAVASLDAEIKAAQATSNEDDEPDEDGPRPAEIKRMKSERTKAKRTLKAMDASLLAAARNRPRRGAACCGSRPRHQCAPSTDPQACDRPLRRHRAQTHSPGTTISPASTAPQSTNSKPNDKWLSRASRNTLRNWIMGSSGLSMKVLDEALAVVETGSRPRGGSDTGTFGLPSLGGENLTLGGTLDLRAIRRIPRDFFASMRTGHLKPSDVLINKDGAQTGKVGKYDGEFDEAAINEHLFLLRGASNIRQDYLFHLLRADQTQRRIRSLVTGSAQPGLNRSLFRKTLVPLPSLNEQQRIAEILDTIDEAIQSTERIITKRRFTHEALQQRLVPIPTSTGRGCSATRCTD